MDKKDWVVLAVFYGLPILMVLVNVAGGKDSTFAEIIYAIFMSGLSAGTFIGVYYGIKEKGYIMSIIVATSGYLWIWPATIKIIAKIL
ncbi:hypothetical protein [Vibrio sp.]|uniref:hypothetical protein n=1 Tax=Vibrio sp. TaxID=678 RepID=UPI00311EC505